MGTDKLDRFYQMAMYHRPHVVVSIRGSRRPGLAVTCYCYDLDIKKNGISNVESYT